MSSIFFSKNSKRLKSLNMFQMVCVSGGGGGGGGGMGINQALSCLLVSFVG